MTARPVLLVAALAVAGCSEKAFVRTTGEAITQAPSARWERGFVRIRFTPRERSPHIILAGGSPARANTVLVFARGAVEEELLLNDLFDTGSGRDALRAAREARYEGRFSPDGATFALRREGAAEWIGADVATRRAPFLCYHRGWSNPDDIRMRDVALSLLRGSATDDLRSHCDGRGPIPTSIESWAVCESELRGAVDFACARPDDRELAAALAEAVRHPMLNQLEAGSDPDPIVRCVGALGDRWPEVRAIVARGEVATADDVRQRGTWVERSRVRIFEIEKRWKTAR